MQIDKMEVEIVGVTPLLLHNGRTANPLDIYSKRLKSLTSKRQKTEDDIRELLMVQWEAGLYYNEELGVYMPSENLYAATLKAAKKHKLGSKMGGVSFPEAIGYPLDVANSKDFQALKSDENNKFIKTVTVQKSKTISCRPIFNTWSLKFDLEFETDIIDANDLRTIMITLSQRIGLGVWTPGSPKPGIHGKFLIKKMKWINSKTKEIKELNI